MIIMILSDDFKLYGTTGAGTGYGESSYAGFWGDGGGNAGTYKESLCGDGLYGDGNGNSAEDERGIYDHEY